MKILTCPVNGPRAVSEFAYGGELRESPDPDRSSDEEWTDYVFNRSGVPGIGVWFIAERDTARDVVLRTYLYQPPAARA